MAPLLGDQPLVGEWDPASRLFTVRGWVPGPAGAAAVDLGDGVELELDVASPTVLTALTVEAPWTGDPRALPDRALALVEALLGPVRTDAVLQLVAGHGDDDLVTRQLGGGGVRTIGGAGADAALARVALAAMHAGVDRDSLLRATAALDAALGWFELPALLVPSGRRGPEGLGAPLGDLVELGDADLAWLDPAGAAALAELVRGALDVLGPDAPPAVRSLVERVDAWTAGRHRDRPAAAGLGMLPSPAAATPSAAGSAPAAAKAARAGAPKAVSPVLPVDCSELDDPPPAGAVFGVRRTEFELEVRAPSQADAASWWARAHSPDGTPLALAPFLPIDGRGPAAAARLLVPAAELRHAVLDVTATPAVPRRSPARAAFDDALDAGRAAARAERLDRPVEAAIHWDRCARRHEAAGDPMRAGQADERAAGERHRRAGSGQRFERPMRLRSDAVAGT